MFTILRFSSGESRAGIVDKLSLAIATVVVLLGTRQARAEAPPLWGRLSPGAHAVGFRSTWELDYSRTYNTTFDDKTKHATGKAPRPVLINVWYPAERAGDARPMPHGGYFEIGSDDPRLAKLATKLAEYARGVATTELFGKSAQEMTPRDRRLWDRLLATPTACTRGARPLAQKGPVVIYHCGAGSSYEDNSVLCEYLASHGYVVIGSAFQQAAGVTLNIDGGEGSARDMAFLIGYASRLPFADWNHVAVAGHSAGAQASLVYASRGATPVDAVVSLDTTQDYESLAHRDWTEFVPVVLASSRNMTMPILFAANAHAIFELADALSGSRRDLLTFKNLEHDEFVSEGQLKGTMKSWWAAGNHNDAPRPPSSPGSPQASYEALCEYILAFLDATLRGDPSRQESLNAAYKQSAIGGNVPHVERIAAGVTAAAPYQDAPGTPPEPRQLRGLLKSRGLEATIAILRATHEKSPDAPVFHTSFGIALVYELLEKRRTPDAIAFHRLYRTLDPDYRKPFFNIGKSYLEYGMKTRALDYFEKAAALDPDNAEAAEQIKALRAAKKAP